MVHMLGSKKFGGWKVMAALLSIFVLLRLAVEGLRFPVAWLGLINILVSLLFLVLPVMALYCGASERWNWKSALAMLVTGVAVQFSGAVVASLITIKLYAGLVFTFSQIGLVLWCLGLGALIATIIKDKNLLLPLGIFLAVFDMWLVFVPEGPVRKVVEQNQSKLASIAWVAPKAAAAPTEGRAADLLYIGPADFLFLSMFFVALFRFNMRTQSTFKAMLPTLAIYLLTVLLFGNVVIGPIRLGALPALLPIGLVVLLTNWREFKLSKDEKQTTVALTVIALGVLIWRFIVAGHPAPTPPEAPKGIPAASAGSSR